MAEQPTRRRRRMLDLSRPEDLARAMEELHLSSARPPVSQMPPSSARPPVSQMPPSSARPPVSQMPPSSVRPPVSQMSPSSIRPPVSQISSDEDWILPVTDYLSCHNASTLYTEILEGEEIKYPSNQILLSYIDVDGKRYCFEPEEIEGLLSYGKNPYNRNDLPDRFKAILREYRRRNPAVVSQAPVVSENAILIEAIDQDLARGPLGNGQFFDPYITFGTFLAQRADPNRWNRLPLNLRRLTDDQLIRNFHNNLTFRIGPVKRNFGLVKIVLSNEPAEREEYENALRPLFEQSGRDFSNRDLRQFNFANVDLRGADFTGSNLSGVIFRHKILNNAIFKRANLTGAQFEYCNLNHASFVDATMVEVQLNFLLNSTRNVDFTGADLTRARIRGDTYLAKFIRADLRNADLMDVNLVGADFTNAKLQNANFSWADLRRANFTGAEYYATNFSNSNRQGIIGGPRINNNGLAI